jgi:hypothetical protein
MSINECDRPYIIIIIMFLSLSLLTIITSSLGQVAYALYFGHKLGLENGDFSLPSGTVQIAATEKGDVYVVWIDKNSTSGDSDIIFSASNDSGNFGSKYALRSNDQLLSSSPQIAATEKGDVYVVWIDKNSTSGDSDIIFSASNDSGKNFASKYALRSNDQLLSSSPQIAATEKGDVYVVWIDKNSTSGYISNTFKASTDKGVKFGPFKRLSEVTKLQSSLSPQIAATEEGNVYVVWSQNGVQFKEIVDNGSIFGETITLSNETNLASLQIASTETGNVYVVWIDSNKSQNGDNVLYFKRISKMFERNS